IAGIPTAACALAATPDHARRIGYCPISNAETRLDPADHRVLVADFHRVSAVLRDVDSVHRKLEGPAPRIDPDLRRSCFAVANAEASQRNRRPSWRPPAYPAGL